MPKNYDSSNDSPPVCYCQRLRKRKQKCNALHSLPRLLNENGWLARCTHPGCSELLLVNDSMKTIPHDFVFKWNS